MASLTTTKRQVFIMATVSIGPVRPVSTTANRGRSAELAIQTERHAGTIVTLVALGLTLANAFVWLAVLAGS
jgi:hypothetical protein